MRADHMKENNSMPDNAYLKQRLAEKQKEFQDAAQNGDFEALEDINNDIDDLLMAMYY